jgi:hypothetical protein
MRFSRRTSLRLVGGLYPAGGIVIVALGLAAAFALLRCDSVRPE